MEKNRKVQILSIFALVFSIAVMSLGFAAFSSTLNISSSSSVAPNSDDFKVRFVGLNGDNQVPSINASGDAVSPQLLSNFCSTIRYGMSVFSEEGEKLSEGGATGLVVKKGEKVRVRIAIFYDYDSWYVDGPVNIEFGNVYLDFGVYAE